MIRFHMIDDKIIDRTFSYGLMYVCKELVLKPGLNRINECNFLIYNQIRIVTNPIREGPKTLKQYLVRVIDPY